MLALAEVTPGCLALSQPRCVPRRWEGVGEQCPWSGMCLQIQEDPCSRAGPFPSCCQTRGICTCAPICPCNWNVHTGILTILIHSTVGTAAPSAPQLSTPQGKIKERSQEAKNNVKLVKLFSLRYLFFCSTSQQSPFASIHLSNPHKSLILDFRTLLSY